MLLLCVSAVKLDGFAGRRIALLQADHFTQQIAYRRSPQKFSCHCLRFSVVPKGSSVARRGAPIVPSGIPVASTGIAGEPKGSHWRPVRSRWRPVGSHLRSWDRRTARLEGKGQGPGLVLGRRVGQGRAQWLGLERAGRGWAGRRDQLESIKIPKFLKFC